MFKWISLLVMGSLAGGCAAGVLEDGHSRVSVELGSPQGTLLSTTYVGPSDAAADFRQALAIELGGEQSTAAPAATFAIRVDDDAATVGGVALLAGDPQDAARMVADTALRIGEGYGFAPEQPEVAGDDGDSVQLGLYASCTNDYCKWLTGLTTMQLCTGVSGPPPGTTCGGTGGGSDAMCVAYCGMCAAGYGFCWSCWGCMF